MAAILEVNYSRILYLVEVAHIKGLIECMSRHQDREPNGLEVDILALMGLSMVNIFEIQDGRIL